MLEGPPGPHAVYRTLNPDAELVRLQRENAALAAQVATIAPLQARLAGVQGELVVERGLRGEAEVACERLSGLLNERMESLRVARERIGVLEGVVAARDTTIAGDTGEIMALSGQLEECQGALGKEREACAGLRVALGSEGKACEGLRREVAQLKAQLEESQEKGEVLGKTVNQLRGTVEEEERQVAALASKMERASGQLSTVSADKDSIINKLTDDLTKVRVGGREGESVLPCGWPLPPYYHSLDTHTHTHSPTLRTPLSLPPSLPTPPPSAWLRRTVFAVSYMRRRTV